MKGWIIEQSRSDGGAIRYSGPPRFTAQWFTGDDPDELAAIDGPCWSDEGSGSGDDSIHIHAFQWTGPAPAQEAFEALMEQAARAIDEWIASRF